MTDGMETAGQVVQNYLNTFFRKDVDKTLECLTHGVVWEVQGAPDVPTLGIRHGKDAVRAWMTLFPDHFSLSIFASKGFLRMATRPL
jgi:uncharacterized protein